MQWGRVGPVGLCFMLFLIPNRDPMRGWDEGICLVLPFQFLFHNIWAKFNILWCSSSFKVGGKINSKMPKTL